MSPPGCCLSPSERQCGALKDRTPVAQAVEEVAMDCFVLELSRPVQHRASWEGFSKEVWLLTDM